MSRRSSGAKALRKSRFNIGSPAGEEQAGPAGARDRRPWKLRAAACLSLAVAAAGVVHAVQGSLTQVSLARAGLGEAILSVHLLAENDEALTEEEFDRALVLPTGAPPSIDCDDARRVVTQARESMASEGGRLDPEKFAAATADWLDPHGLGSVAPDSPVQATIRVQAERLLAELESTPETAPCSAADPVATALAAWTDELGRSFDEGAAEAERAAPPKSASTEGYRIAAASPFDDAHVTRNARAVSRDIGRQSAALRRIYGDSIAPFTDAARARVAPVLDRGAWTQAVFAAALRAYIPQLDAHGAWAPLEEELSVYDLSLEANPPERLWSEITRTSVGVRVDRGALPPLKDGDIVLRAHDIALAGLSVEQAEQLSVVDPHADASAKVVVLRSGASAPLELTLARRPNAPPPVDDMSASGAELVRYGDGEVLLLPIADVPDDLAAKVGRSITLGKSAGSIRGVMLDLRGNGGGSTDGAIGTIGLFLPGAALFPMRRRDGAIEVDRAPTGAPDERWTGPLAVLVDGDSASAAEMIAGAIASYRRGVVLGDLTFGKGCAQEYLDDEAHAGVLRLTTLLYALPDGSPVQKVGIDPQIHLALPASKEREASMARALGPWPGPDVRDRASIREVPWSNHGGRVGPCRDETVCRALRALGAQRAAAR